MSDGGLGKLFQKHLPKFDWQRIESGGTGLGIPDLNFCHKGMEGWIENKLVANGEKITFQEGQVAWHERRVRHGGRCFIAVRRQCSAGPRKGPAVDSIRLYSGLDVKGLAVDPRAVMPLIVGLDGPERWPWEQIGLQLMQASFLSFPDYVTSMP